MEFSYTTIFTALTCFVTSIVLTFTRPKRRLNLPPGPSGWPIVGNLLQVAGSGKPFFQSIKELFAKYGPIITLKMGNQTMAIISQADLVHEALIQEGQIFATRPADNPTRIMFSCDKFSVNAALYGPVWRSWRRNMVQNVLSPSKLHAFKDVRIKCNEKLVDRLKAEAAANSGAVWVLKNVRFNVFCILLSMCFGVEMDEKTVKKMDEMMKQVLITIHPRVDDFLPLLRPLFLKQRKRASEVREQQIALLVPFIEQRRAVIKKYRM